MMTAVLTGSATSMVSVATGRGTCPAVGMMAASARSGAGS
jgi:hypothetical protein